MMAKRIDAGEAMIAALDVHYVGQTAYAAGVAFAAWSDPTPISERVVALASVAAYEPGAFYKRELPPLLHVLNGWEAAPDHVVVDGYVWLGVADGAPAPGLGARLFDALAGRAAVIGVAKTAYRSAAIAGPSRAVEIRRGQSAAPLFITATGMRVDTAAQGILTMHGPHRIPTLLKRVDALARDRARGDIA